MDGGWHRSNWWQSLQNVRQSCNRAVFWISVSIFWKILSLETDLSSLLTLVTIVFSMLKITRGLKIFWENGPCDTKVLPLTDVPDFCHILTYHIIHILTIYLPSTYHLLTIYLPYAYHILFCLSQSAQEDDCHQRGHRDTKKSWLSPHSTGIRKWNPEKGNPIIFFVCIIKKYNQFAR